MSPYDDPSVSAGEIADYLHSQSQPMKAISLIQPYATLVALGYKQYETRSWPTKHLGPLAIAASAGSPAWALDEYKQNRYMRQILSRHGLSFKTLPRGFVLGVCQVEGMHLIGPAGATAQPNTLDPDSLTPMERAFGDYTTGRWAWKLEDAIALPEPIRAKGKLGLWELPTDIVAQLP